MIKILTPWLSNFRWFRKRLGGTWYKVIDTQDYTAWHSPEAVWTDQEPEEGEVVETENHPKQKLKRQASI